MHRDDEDRDILTECFITQETSIGEVTVSPLGRPVVVSQDRSMQQTQTDQITTRTGEALPLRATRVADLVAGFLSTSADARSIDELCRSGAIGVAPSTLRRWCQGERIIARRVLDLARLLRALSLARQHGTPLSEWLDIDPRTLDTLVQRAQVPELVDARLPSMCEFIVRQRLVSNPTVMRLLEDQCRKRELTVPSTDIRAFPE